MKRGVADRQQRNSVHFDAARLDRVKSKHVRHKVDGGGGIAALIEQSFHAHRVTHRQRNIDRIDRVPLHERRDVRAGTGKPLAALRGQTLGAAKVEKSQKRAGADARFDAARQLEPDVSGPDDDMALRRRRAARGQTHAD